MRNWLYFSGLFLLAGLAGVTLYSMQSHLSAKESWVNLNSQVQQLLEKPPEDGQAATKRQTEQQTVGSTQDQGEAVIQVPPQQPSQQVPIDRPAGLIDLNRATLAQLDELPGIGPGKAQAIIDYRLQAGLFKSVDEIMNVKGIGPKLFEKMRDRITVSPK